MDQAKAEASARAANADRRATWQGFSDGFTQAVEMAVTPVLFALGGLYLDGRLGTDPWLAATFAAFAMVGSFFRAYYHYVARVEELERHKPWRRPTGVNAGPSQGHVR